MHAFLVTMHVHPALRVFFFGGVSGVGFHDSFLVLNLNKSSNVVTEAWILCVDQAMHSFLGTRAFSVAYRV
jgi:hypothetical protein